MTRSGETRETEYSRIESFTDGKDLNYPDFMLSLTGKTLEKFEMTHFLCVITDGIETKSIDISTLPVWFQINKGNFSAEMIEDEGQKIYGIRVNKLEIHDDTH